MANSIGSRYIDPGSSPQRMAQAEKAIQQLQRAMTNLPKPAAAGTFPVGQTRCEAGQFHQSNNSIVNQSAVYGEAWEFSEQWGEAPTFTEAANGFLVPTETGRYHFAVQFNTSWVSGAVPPYITLSADYDDRTLWDYPRWDRSPNVNDHIAERFDVGPWELDAGQGFWFGANWLTDDQTFMDGFVVYATLLG